MTKKKKQSREKLRKWLTPMMMIYFKGLSAKKEDKLRKYLEKKMDEVGAYYFDLLGKKSMVKEEPTNLLNELPVKTAEMENGQFNG